MELSIENKVSSNIINARFQCIAASVMCNLHGEKNFFVVRPPTTRTSSNSSWPVDHWPKRCQLYAIIDYNEAILSVSAKIATPNLRFFTWSQHEYSLKMLFKPLLIRQSRWKKMIGAPRGGAGARGLPISCDRIYRYSYRNFLIYRIKDWRNTKQPRE